MKLKKLLDIKRQINKPEYFYNPGQIIKRLGFKNKGNTKHGIPMGPAQKSFYVSESDVIGRSILTMGVYDLIVAESLKRLLEPGSTFVDVGANIGYFSRLASDWGCTTHSFEPHPKLFERLKDNLPEMKTTRLYQKALSSQQGSFDLYIPENWESNAGIASLEPLPNGEKVKVQTERLDDLGITDIDVLKVDVEGHELEVFKGAEGLLDSKNIGHIIFEEFGGPQAPTLQFLQGKGMVIKALLKTLRGPILLELSELNQLPKYEPPNFIAGWDESSLTQVFQKRGWQFYQTP